MCLYNLNSTIKKKAKYYAVFLAILYDIQMWCTGTLSDDFNHSNTNSPIFWCSNLRIVYAESFSVSGSILQLDTPLYLYTLHLAPWKFCSPQYFQAESTVGEISPKMFGFHSSWASEDSFRGLSLNSWDFAYGVSGQSIRIGIRRFKLYYQLCHLIAGW